jgi:hypothetical protein
MRYLTLAFLAMALCGCAARKHTVQPRADGTCPRRYIASGGMVICDRSFEYACRTKQELKRMIEWQIPKGGCTQTVIGDSSK